MANEFIARKGLIALSDSQITGSLNISQNLNVVGGLTASFDSSTSTAISGAFTSVSSSIASERLKNTTDTLTGDLTVTGTITAQDLVVQEITSSVIYSSGSNIFGNDSANTHTFTGTPSFNKSDDLRLTLTDTGDNSSLVLRADAVNEIYTGTNNDLQIYTNGNQNGQIFLDQSRGNVGIGNTDPTAKLTVGGNIYSTTLVQAGVGILQGDATYGAVLGSNSSARGIAISRDSTPGTYPDLIVTGSNGDVGIGTANPSAKLHIWSPNTSGAIGLYLGNTSNPDHGNVLAIARRGTDFTLNDSSLVIYSKQNSFGTYEAAHFRARGYKFQKHDGTEFLAINQDGNIGIGTNDPSATLHLRASAPYIYLDDSSTSGTRTRFQLTVGDVGVTQSATFSFNNTSSTSLKEVLTLNENGNVGVGTNTLSSGAMLDVSGSLAISNTGQINLTRTLSTNNLWYGMRYDNSEVQIYTYNAGGRSITFNTVYGGSGIVNQLMKIPAEGNVGIGTTNPSSRSKLHVYNSGNDATYNSKIQAIFGPFDYQDSDAANMFGAGTSETQFLNGTSNRPAMISLGGGLAVNESVGVINFFRSGNTNGYRSRAIIDCGVFNNGTADQHGGRLRFWTANDGSTNPGVRMVIMEAGHVGIGTTSSSTVLQVHGQQKWYTTNADGNELRGFFNPGGSSDDALLSLYKADGSSSGLELGATYINLGLRTYNSVNGVTMYGSAGTIQSDITANSTGYEVFLVNNITSGGTASVVQYRTNGVVEGSIHGTSSGLSISNNSDYRKKTEIRDLSGSLAVVDSLQPRLYKYREGFGKPTDKDFVGFIAHEIQEILPDSVNNNKDDVYTQEDIDNGVTGFNVGDPKYQTVAYSSNEIITYLVGAVKELKAEIDALKNA